MNLLPYVIFIVCMLWDVDGPYWVLEDFAPETTKRSECLTYSFLLLRAFLLLPGFFETTRTLLTAMILFGIVVQNVLETVTLLTYRVKNFEMFLSYYSQLSILCNAFELGSSRTFFITITIFYLGFIHSWWLCIRGLGSLTPVILSFCFGMAIGTVIAIITVLPMVAVLGDRLAQLRDIKVNACNEACYGIGRTNWRKKRTLTGKVNVRRAKAIHPLKFSYGSCFPLGKSFCRNIVGNGIEKLLTFVLLFDISGRVYK